MRDMSHLFADLHINSIGKAQVDWDSGEVTMPFKFPLSIFQREMTSLGSLAGSGIMDLKMMLSGRTETAAESVHANRAHPGQKTIYEELAETPEPPADEPQPDCRPVVAWDIVITAYDAERLPALAAQIADLFPTEDHQAEGDAALEQQIREVIDGGAEMILGQVPNDGQESDISSALVALGAGVTRRPVHGEPQTEPVAAEFYGVIVEAVPAYEPKSAREKEIEKALKDASDRLKTLAALRVELKALPFNLVDRASAVEAHQLKTDLEKLGLTIVLAPWPADAPTGAPDGPAAEAATGRTCDGTGVTGPCGEPARWTSPPEANAEDQGVWCDGHHNEGDLPLEAQHAEPAGDHPGEAVQPALFAGAPPPPTAEELAARDAEWEGQPGDHMSVAEAVVDVLRQAGPIDLGDGATITVGSGR